MKVLVIGLGSMGKRRIRLLQGFEQVSEIVGVDSRKERRNATLDDFGCNVYSSIDEAFCSVPEINCAFVCTDPLSHGKIINTLLRKNVHIFSEINLVTDGYVENIALAKKVGKVLFLSSTFLYREEIRLIRADISGCSNMNYIYHIGQYLPDWHPWESYNDFFIGNKCTNGCREIMAIELPWLLKTFGDVVGHSVMSDKMSALNISYNDNYMIYLQHENNNKGVLIVDVVSPKPVRNLEIYGEKIYYSWNGSPDSLQKFDSSEKKLISIAMQESIEHNSNYSLFIVENAYRNEIREFFKIIQTGNSCEYGFEDDIKTLDLIDEIEESYE